jgi:hypothetical protein
VLFDYLANLRKLKKKSFEGWAGVMKSLLKGYGREKMLGYTVLDRPNKFPGPYFKFGHDNFPTHLVQHIIYFKSRGYAVGVASGHRLAAARVRAQVMWDFWWTNRHWSKFSPCISFSLANSHSTDCSTLFIIIIIHYLGLVQWHK